jgi:hypothetical protein
VGPNCLYSQYKSLDYSTVLTVSLNTIYVLSLFLPLFVSNYGTYSVRMIYSRIGDRTADIMVMEYAAIRSQRVVADAIAT